MIDIHCHLLPGIDDGPPTLEAALELARALVSDGIDHVVCTPHVFPGRFENRRTSIQDEFYRFVGQLAAAGVDLSLSFAGEVRLTPEVLGLMSRDELPLLGEGSNGQRTMLLELPDGQIPVGTERFVDKLLDADIRPVIAHPERNRAVIENPARIETLVDMGCYLQLTASSVTGHFGERVQRTSRKLIEANWVQAVASDSHNLGGRRPRMKDAAAWLARQYGPGAARRLVFMGPAALCHRTGQLPRPVRSVPPLLDSGLPSDLAA